SMGCVNHLAFASECGDIKVLNEIAKVTASTEFKSYFKNEISTGISYPTALSNTMGNFECSLKDTISSPNNVLGIEYIKALNEINSSIIPFTILRKGDAHNSTDICSEFASASNIRRILVAKTDVTNYIPENCIDILKNAVNNGQLATLDNNMRGVLLKLRNMIASDIAKIADVNEGLEHRLHNAINTSCSVDEIIENTKTKRYTYARIRRLIISCLLDITKEFTEQRPDYIRVLGFTKKGAEVLNTMKHTSSVPIVTKLTNLPEGISDNAKRMLELEIKSTDLYYTFTNSLNMCGMEYKNGLVIIK
ncbi:MAG: nucleotidyltransferase family protein, partial [Acutalibacteraceae bacterium]|nr:nucleotidyltransferase family protein [Acutalibacteraceae bacterium]